VQCNRLYVQAAFYTVAVDAMVISSVCDATHYKKIERERERYREQRLLKSILIFIFCVCL